VAFPPQCPTGRLNNPHRRRCGISLFHAAAGTGLVGGVLGDGLVIDFSRHNRQISDLNLDGRTVCVGAGVVLDQLNASSSRTDFVSGPDVATSSRATLGGMIANNSSGSHVPFYGVTADHVLSLQVVLGMDPSSGRERITIRFMPNVNALANSSANMPPGSMSNSRRICSSAVPGTVWNRLFASRQISAISCWK